MSSSMTIRLWLACAVAFLAVAPLRAEDAPMAAKWSRFERAFTTTVTYAHPLEDVSVTVFFTSPLGDTIKADAFWDGEKTWRVRIAPDMLGQWRYRTVCSDASNLGLNNITGGFLCIPAMQISTFDKHGSIQLDRFHQHLEHQDHAPFLWVADTAWNGAVVSEAKDWKAYVDQRAAQKFTVCELTGTPTLADISSNHIALNFTLLHQIDARIAALNHAGILSAIAPLASIPSGQTNVNVLPAAAAKIWLRYAIARWGADNVAWLFPFDGATAKEIREVARGVFAKNSHAPVVVENTDAYYLLDSFRDESWADLFAYQKPGHDLSDENLEWTVVGPIGQDWKKSPPHPYLNFTPIYLGETTDPSGVYFGANTIRRAAYWGLLISPPIGVSFGIRGTWGAKTHDSSSILASAESQSLADQVGVLANFFSSVDFNSLRPAPQMIVDQPGRIAPARYIAAASNAAGTLAVVYIPEDRSVTLAAAALPANATAVWIDPRTGERSPAKLSSLAKTINLSTPGIGDWLLLVTAK